MNYRLSTIMAKTSYAADKTEIINLDMVDPLSELLIGLDVVNVTASPTAHAIACLKKIEIVDGSEVLYSLSGYEAEGADIYHNKRIRSNWNPYINTLPVQRYIGINFGRYLWDKELAFDPTKFNSPQLKLTLDIDAGGCASILNYLQVWGALFDQKTISPSGFLMHKEVKEYVLGISTHEYIDLPRDYPYRKLFIRSLDPGSEVCQNIANIKLSEDQDKRVVFDHPSVDILRAIAHDNPQLIEQIIFDTGTSTAYVYTTVSDRATATFAPWRATSATNAISSYGSAGGRMATIAGASMNAVAIVAGWIPHGVLEYPFGLQDQIDDWYNVAGIGSLKLDITGAAGCTGDEKVQIFLQQLRKY